MPTVSELRVMYDEMVLARRYEERLQEEHLEGKQPAFDISAGPVPGELHLAAGHEASSAGVRVHLRDDDTVTAPHRPHHVAISKGGVAPDDPRFRSSWTHSPGPSARPRANVAARQSQRY